MMSEFAGPTTPGPTSLSLLESARNNCPEAWSRLVYLYGGLVYGWCRRSGLQETDAADVTQTVFSSVSTGLHRFDGRSDRSTFRGWLRVITSNRIRDWARGNRHRPLAIGGSTAHGNMQSLLDTNDAATDCLISDTPRNERMHEALAQVRGETEDRTWQAFWLTTVESRPAADVAAELGMKRQAVFQAKSRTLKRLRAILEFVPEE